jgi:hypothetical protein
LWKQESMHPRMKDKAEINACTLGKE